MIPGRLRECLRILRWKPTDLAEQLGCTEIEVRAWLEGRTRAPIAAAAWLEALVKAHKALPPPSCCRLEITSDAGPIEFAVLPAIRHPGTSGTAQFANAHRIAKSSDAAATSSATSANHRPFAIACLLAH